MRNWIPMILLTSLMGCSSAPPVREEVYEKRNLAAQYMEFGNRYYQDADYPQALQLYLLARNYFSSVDDTAGTVRAYNALGKTYLQMGDGEAAETHISFALDLATASGEESLILQTVNHLSGVYLQRKDFSKAYSLLDSYRARVPQSSPWSEEHGVFYHNLGAALFGQGRLEEAEEAVTKASAINLELKNYRELASNHYLLALIRQKLGNLTQAFLDGERALKYDKQMENSVGIGQDLLLLGFLKEQEKAYEEAFDFYSRAFFVYRALNHRSGMSRSLRRLEEMAEKTGRPADARLYHEAKESLEAEGTKQ